MIPYFCTTYNTRHTELSTTMVSETHYVRLSDQETKSLNLSLPNNIKEIKPNEYKKRIKNREKQHY